MTEIASVYEGYTIKRVPKFIDQAGRESYYIHGTTREERADKMPEWLQGYEIGIYTIVGGYYFKEEQYFEISDRTGKDVFMWVVDESELLNSFTPNKALLSSIADAHRQSFVHDEFEEEYEPYGYDSECSRCRGGGCPSCDTTGYFTGLTVSYF